jgi:tetratricopeptide (TPR) repeat protein
MTYRSSCFLIATLVGTTVALVQVQPVLSVKSVSEVEAIARSTAVQMTFERRSGRVPGIIIHRQGSLYTLVASQYLLSNEGRGLSDVGTITLHLPDGIKYQVSTEAIKQLDRSASPVDLAIVQFRSDRNYKVAKLAAPNSLKPKDKLYTAGFYSSTEYFGFDPSRFNFEVGKVVATVNKRLTDDEGYTFVYDTVTPEVYGGGIFDRDGQLVAIHGHERYWHRDLAKRAIPIRWLMQNLAEVGIDLGGDPSSDKALPMQIPTTADDYFIAGFNEFSTDKAVEKFSRAIQLNLKYQRAYFERARARSFSGMIGDEETEKARLDFSQAILLDPKDYRAYYYRVGLIKLHSKEAGQKAIREYDQVILLNPKFSLAYYRRAELRSYYLDDFQGAVADYDQIILLDPQDAKAYGDRASLKVGKLNDIQSALADYNQIIAIFLNQKSYNRDRDKNLIEAYKYRATLKAEKLNDIQGGLADYNQIIALYPKYYEAYYKRAKLKHKKLNDRQGALTDYNQAILIANNNYDIYSYYEDRALLREELGDRQGALADREKASENKWKSWDRCRFSGSGIGCTDRIRRRS